MKNRMTAIILAAGQGKRMNSQVAKQFLMLRDKPVLYYTLKAFEKSSVDEIILVTGKDQEEYCQNEIVQKYQLNKISHIIEGGRERYDSVYRGLLSANETDYVLIHDGARPFVSQVLIERIISEVQEYKACIIGTPVKETIKMINKEGYITATPNRNTLWSAQTPQAFAYKSIRKAFDLLYAEGDRVNLAITDDAMVYETFLNQPVKMIMGDYNNIKLTTPEDLLLAEIIMNELLYE
jgi:2-C-methyl-D-erythritol 4-phosphate cytidylyltransferase